MAPSEKVIAFIGVLRNGMFRKGWNAEMSTGIGVMGFPMAVNLRTKMDKNSKLLVCDVSPEQIERYQAKVQGAGEVEVVSNGAEAAKLAVGFFRSSTLARAFL